MTVLDILIAIPLIFFIYRGWRRGLIFELSMLMGIIAGCWAATHLSVVVANLLQMEGDTGVLVTFFVCFVGAVALAFFLGKTIEGVFKMVKAGTLNHLLGALLGMLKCLCVLSVLINFVMLIDREHVIITPETQEKSVLYEPTYNVGNRLTNHLKDKVKDLRKYESENENK